MENRIVRYGERGIVESIVLGIIEKNRTKQFLKAIRWSNSSKPEWIDDVQNTTWIVEIGLGQFGDPDLILVCRTREGNTYYLFVEAKVNRYVDSSFPNSGGMVRGFNSGINGQLSLKYRFCKALEVWDGDNYRIVEPPELFEAYKKSLKDTIKRPRRLSKPSILRYVLKQNDFHQATIDNCYFVALTWDREPGPFKDTSLDPDLLPLFLSKAGINQWSVLKKNVGWIGYGVIHRELDLPVDFQSTLKLMTPSIEPTRVEGYPETSIRIQNWRNFSELTRNTAENVLEEAVSVFGIDSIRRLQGSYSIIRDNVILKIIPLRIAGNESLILGISMRVWLEDLSDLIFRGPYSIQRRPFMIYEFRPEDWKNVKISIISLFVNLLNHASAHKS